MKNRLFIVSRESLYPGNHTFEVTQEILIENTEKWSKFAYKSENSVKISLDRESLYSDRNWIDFVDVSTLVESFSKTITNIGKLISAFDDRESLYLRKFIMIK